jgi:hypothetical protein
MPRRARAAHKALVVRKAPAVRRACVRVGVPGAWEPASGVRAEDRSTPALKKAAPSVLGRVDGKVGSAARKDRQAQDRQAQDRPA